MLFLWPKEFFDKIPSDPGWQSESASLHDPDLHRRFEKKIFLANLWHERLHFKCKNDGISIIGKNQDEV